MLTREDNELMCRVDPGTGMGAAMRRYWLPALEAAELPHPDCDPKHVELLGEHFVVFRDTARIEAEETEFGFHYAALRSEEQSHRIQARVTAFIAPCTILNPNGDAATIVVPRNDESSSFFHEHPGERFDAQHTRGVQGVLHAGENWRQLVPHHQARHVSAVPA